MSSHLPLNFLMFQMEGNLLSKLISCLRMWIRAWASALCLKMKKSNLKVGSR
jgi:hypothetical protein